MNAIQRLGPPLHAALHSYNTVWELLLTPRVRRAARADLARLQQRLPALAGYQAIAAEVRRAIEPDYRDYTTNVSPGSIAISFELAVFASVLCRLTRPRAILDLGSGFSSFVFRAHARQADPRPLVYSIDDSPAWLGQTRRFLEPRGLATDHLLTWNDLVAGDRPPFDLILHDIDTLKTRLRRLDQVLDLCRPDGGLVIIDDMHVPGYRRAVLAQLDRRGCAHFSLRSLTRKRMRYSYLVAR
jgi:predicted O-methyltransferase YrrM